MPKLLNTSSAMMCPHGGTVSAVSANSRTKARGAFVLRPSDTFTIAGCTLNVAGAPHPCVRVQWVTSAARSKAVNDFSLNEQSVGMCMAADSAPQGAVLINNTQPAVGGT